MKIDEVKKITKNQDEVNMIIKKLQTRYGEDVIDTEYWKKLLLAPNYVCPKCNSIVGYVRTDCQKNVLGCDNCLKIQGYCGG